MKLAAGTAELDATRETAAAAAADAEAEADRTVALIADLRGRLQFTQVGVRPTCQEVVSACCVRCFDQLACRVLLCLLLSQSCLCPIAAPRTLCCFRPEVYQNAPSLGASIHRMAPAMSPLTFPARPPPRTILLICLQQAQAAARTAEVLAMEDGAAAAAAAAQASAVTIVDLTEQLHTAEVRGLSIYLKMFSWLCKLYSLYCMLLA